MAESTKEATAEGAKVTTVATGAHATADAPVEPETGFPLYAMRMRDFLELTRLEPHNTLAAKGLVVPVDFSGEHRGERLNFVSHQWLGFDSAGGEVPLQLPQARRLVGFDGSQLDLVQRLERRHLLR